MAKRPVMVFYSITVAKDGDDQSSCFVYLTYYIILKDQTIYICII